MFAGLDEIKLATLTQAERKDQGSEDNHSLEGWWSRSEHFPSKKSALFEVLVVFVRDM